MLKTTVVILNTKHVIIAIFIFLWFPAHLGDVNSMLANQMAIHTNIYTANTPSVILHNPIQSWGLTFTEKPLFVENCDGIR